jgi:Glyoxalase/Bleomycin resistance protein/Dioxygenase superfamily
VDDEIGQLLGGSPYHVGIVVEDVGAAMVEYGRLFGVEWTPRMGAEFPVALAGGRRNLTFDAVYSTTGPVRVELTVQKPDSIWTPGAGIHHIGFWSDDVSGDSDRLAAAGYPIEAVLFPLPDDSIPAVAFCRGPQNLFVELVWSGMRSGMESTWADAPARD